MDQHQASLYRRQHQTYDRPIQLASRGELARLSAERILTGIFVSLSFAGICSCAQVELDAPTSDKVTVADSMTRAVASNGAFISWNEHIIDGQDANGGVPIRGGDGIAIVDLDRDGFLDVVTAQEDSNHIRIAFGSHSPNTWELATLAEGAIVGAVEDVAVGDLNGDGWPDIVAACEEAHLVYFENPGSSVRDADWAYVIPQVTQNRGSWLRVFVADVNGDGGLDLTAANKGAADIVRLEDGDPDNGTTSLFTFSGPPLLSGSWREQVLYQNGVPNTALPVDIDADGDIDVLAAKRVRQQLVIVENLGTDQDGSLLHRSHPVEIKPAFSAADDWRALTNAFQADVADLNQDGRIDIVLNVIERSDAFEGLTAGLGWLEQPTDLKEPWVFHRIGNTLPDWVIGIHLADIDGDGDLDVVTGGYSGLNVLKGSYSGSSRDFDEPSVDENRTVGRIAWFENPNGLTAKWQRHDISRRVRGMYDMFESLDMDGDGDLDLVAPRGNSGSFDGAFWLEQVRSDDPRRSFTPGRKSESRPLGLPPEDWRDRYTAGETYVAPNKTEP